MLVNRLNAYEKTENGWLLHADAADVMLVFLTDDIIRIRVNFDRKFDEASYTLVTTAWSDRLDPLFESERQHIKERSVLSRVFRQDLLCDRSRRHDGV